MFDYRWWNLHYRGQFCWRLHDQRIAVYILLVRISFQRLVGSLYRYTYPGAVCLPLYKLRSVSLRTMTLEMTLLDYVIQHLCNPLDSSFLYDFNSSASSPWGFIGFLSVSTVLSFLNGEIIIMILYAMWFWIGETTCTWLQKNYLASFPACW